MNQAKQCMTAAKCDCPAFTEGFHSAETKLQAAEANDARLADEAGRVIGNRLGAAIESHKQRWQKIWVDRANAFKAVSKTAGCDIDCVQKCTQTPHHATYNGTAYNYYPGVDQCGVECKCFDSTVQINWGSIHYQKIAEKEYGKPIA